MDFLTLETNRLLLIGITPDDMNTVFSRFSKSEAKELLGHRSDSDYEKELEKQKKGYASYNRTFLLFLLKDKESNQIIGRCGIHNWNKDHRRAEIGYSMENENFKRKSLMSEAVDRIIKYAFNELNLNRLEALVGADNIASLRIIEKNNFKKEGVLKKHYFVDGEFTDSICFGLLKEEYYL